MICGRLKIARATMPFYMTRKRWTKWEKASILSTNRLQFAALVTTPLPPAPPRRTSELRSAPSATLSIPASRSWLTPVDVLTVSTRDSIWSKLSRACCELQHALKLYFFPANLIWLLLTGAVSWYNIMNLFRRIIWNRILNNISRKEPCWWA